MIALNEIVVNPKKFEEVYDLMGRRYNIKKIIFLAKKMKIFGQKSEDFRSKCNKICPKIAELKGKNENLKPTLLQIKKLDRLSKKYQKKFEIAERKVSWQLKKLPNLPDEIFSENKVISEGGNQISLLDFQKFVLNENVFEFKDFKAKNVYKKYKNFIFSEAELPLKINCKDGIIIFNTDYFIDKELENILNFSINQNLNLVRLSFDNYSKSSCDEYLVSLSDDKEIKIELKREFNTREHSIKYKNSKFDRNQFVNEVFVRF